MSVQRILGKVERMLVISDRHYPLNLVSVLSLHPVPPVEILRQAWSILQARHPFLRVRIVEQEREFVFVDAERPITIRVLGRADDLDWQAAAEYELNTPIEVSQGPLLRCVLLAGETAASPGELILCCHHSIMDGVSLAALVDELLVLCAGLALGQSMQAEQSQSPLPPVEERFPPALQGFDRWRRLVGFVLAQMGDEVSYQLRTLGRRRPPLSLSARGRILTMQLAPQLSQALVRRARRERVTLFSALNAAMLLAVDRQLYGGQGGWQRYMPMADLRPYVEPPPAAGQLGAYFGMLRFTVQMPDDGDLWQLARRINRQILHSGRRGDKFIAAWLSEEMVRLVLALRRFRLATTALSYTGVAPLQARYGPYQLPQVRAFISNNGLGPEFTAHVGLFQETLHWDLLYMDHDLTPDGARQMAEQIRAVLAAACQE